MKRKWLETLAISGSLVILAVGTWSVLSRLDRTPILYEYEDTVNLFQEEEPTLVTEQEKTENTETLEEYQRPENRQEPQDNDRTGVQQASDQGRNSDVDNVSGGKGRSGGKGGSGRDGDGGSGDGGTDGVSTPAPVVSPLPSATPVIPNPTDAPAPTENPHRIVKITCDWPDKDSIKYMKTIPRDTMVVKSVDASGEETELDDSQYTVIGLYNNVVGKHNMTVVYDDFECTLRYTVNNYIVGLDFDWETKDACYIGEVIDDDVLTVYTEMANDDFEEVEFGEYTISGIDNMCTGRQTFTIRYGAYSVSDTCEFKYQKLYSTAEYYVIEENGDEILVDSKLTSRNTSRGENIGAYKEEEKIQSGPYAGTYELKETVVTVDGAEKKLPYRVRARDFDIRVTVKYYKKK